MIELTIRALAPLSARATSAVIFHASESYVRTLHTHASYSRIRKFMCKSPSCHMCLNFPNLDVASAILLRTSDICSPPASMYERAQVYKVSTVLSSLITLPHCGHLLLHFFPLDHFSIYSRRSSDMVCFLKVMSHPGLVCFEILSTFVRFRAHNASVCPLSVRVKLFTGIQARGRPEAPYSLLTPITSKQVDCIRLSMNDSFT